MRSIMTGTGASMSPPKTQPLTESVTVEIPISYSHKNKKLVRELHEGLQKVLDARKPKIAPTPPR